MHEKAPSQPLSHPILVFTHIFSAGHRGGGERSNPNTEARNPTRSPKSEARTPPRPGPSDFALLSGFGLRVSGFLPGFGLRGFGLAGFARGVQPARLWDRISIRWE